MAVLVSIYCMAYNHEKYIRNALEGFVNQVTDFEYEIIVHDDASTDSTAAIILEYAEKYPQIIIPVIQKENQYSRGVNIFKEFIFPQMSGKYIAVCEGDDYWCDNYKLQKQVDFLERHKKFIGCVHDSTVINSLDGSKTLFSKKKRAGTVSMREIINWGCVFHTASLVYRRYIWEGELLKTVNGIGDYPFALQLRLNGKIYFMKEPMAVYRANTEGSWSRRNQERDENEKAMIIILEEFDRFSHRKYTKLVKIKIDALMIQIYYRNKQIEKLKQIGSLHIARVGYGKLAISIFLQKRCNRIFPLLRSLVKKF